jgi:hypothetical protein
LRNRGSRLHPRDDDGLSALDDAPGDPLAETVARALGRLPADAGGGRDHELALFVVQQRHRAAHDAMVLLEDLQATRQGSLQVEVEPSVRLSSSRSNSLRTSPVSNDNSEGRVP